MPSNAEIVLTIANNVPRPEPLLKLYAITHNACQVFTNLPQDFVDPVKRIVKFVVTRQHALLATTDIMLQVEIV